MRGLTLATAAGGFLLALASAQQQQQQKQHPFSLTAPSLDSDRITFSSASSQPANFSGQKVVRFSKLIDYQQQALLSQAHELGLDVWSADLGKVDVRLANLTHSVADEIMGDLLRPFEGGKGRMLKSQVLIDDLEAMIQSQRRSEVKSSKQEPWHQDYHTLDEIEAYMRLLERTYSTHAQVIEIGQTHEGRSILALKLGSDLPIPSPRPDPPTNTTAVPTLRPEKLGIVMTGGQHAREWISTSASLYFASDLLHSALGNPSKSSAFSELKKKKKGKKGKKSRRTKAWSKKQANSILSTFTITIIPVSNPDGYEYSWTHNRMWRKNRQPNNFPGGLFCKGVDLNRNYNYAFASGGSSFNPCSEMYPGTSAFSAAESAAIGRYLEKEENNVKGYFDLHSYGQLLMYPFSSDCSKAPADEEDLLELSLGAIAALKRVHGKSFTAGKICGVYAEAGGNAVDWTYASTTPVSGNEAEEGEKRKIKWSYSIELRDGGTYGFLLPKEQIVPASQEVTNAIAYMLNFIAKKDNH